MRKLLDVYCKHLLQEALDPVDEVELEKPIASPDSQFVDVFCVPRPNRPAPQDVPILGVVWKMSAETCSFEPCSKSPTVNDLRTLGRKQLSLHLQLCKESGNKELPLPKQWVLSPGRPHGGLKGLKATPMEGWPTGFYSSGAFLDMWIVVLSELPLTEETRLLRLLGPKKMQQRVLAEIQGLPKNDLSREWWLEIVGKMVYFFDENRDRRKPSEEQLAMTKLRQEFEQFKESLIRKGEARGEARGKAEGKADGKAEGKAEGKADALLAVMAARGVAVTDLVRKAVMTCQDPATLDRWLVQAATAPSPDAAIVFGA